MNEYLSQLMYGSETQVYIVQDSPKIRAVEEGNLRNKLELGGKIK